MSQLAAPVPAPRPLTASPGRDAPDALFILRHYRWLLIIGTLVGTMLGLSSFWLCRKYVPEYESSVVYQVLPQQGPEVGNGDKTALEILSPEEVTRFIARQKNLVKVDGDAIWEEVLKTDTFQFDYRDKDKPTRRKSAFMLANEANPKAALRKIVDVVAIPNTDLYHLTIRGRDPQEITEQVKAFALVYENFLKSRVNIEERKKLEELKDTRKDLQQRVDIAQAAVENFREAHDIPGISQNSQRLATELAAMDTKLVEAESNLNQARANYEAVKKQVDLGTFKLPPEYQNAVDNDAGVSQLEAEKRALQREREVMLQGHGPEYAAVRALDVRIAACAKQADAMRDEASAKLRLQVVENANRQFTGNQAFEQDLRTRRNDLLLQVKDLDHWLSEFATRTDNLKREQSLLAELDQKILLIEVHRNSDSARMREFSPATVPDKDEPAFPLLKMFLPAGVFGGLVIAFGLAYLLELTNTRVRTPRDITKTMQMPLLGFVPDQEDDSMVNGDLMTSIRTSPSSMIAESFRQIRGRLAAQSDGAPLTTMLVASIAPGGGATTVASNLANGIALNGVRVLLVDANFYRPGLGMIYRNIPAMGLSDVIAGRAKIEDAIMESTELPTLHVMGTGSVQNTASSELMESKAFRDVLNQLKSTYDLVIFDGAPLSLVSDSLTLAARLDGVVAVVRAGTISRGTVGRIRDQLRQVRANLLGLVLNAAQTHGSGYFKENYRSFYQYASPANAPRKPTHAIGS
jgi:polysaccharide biosynthesis transport protein